MIKLKGLIMSHGKNLFWRKFRKVSGVPFNADRPV